jgi:hypothetical protein
MFKRLPVPGVLAASAAVLAAAPAALRAQGAAAHGAATPAAAVPDYSGTWELDPAKSDFGPQPAPARMVMRVRHAGAQLQIVGEASTGAGERRDSVLYTLGGPAVTHDVANVGPSTTSAAVEGGRIVTRSTIRTQGAEIPVSSRWALAPDGKVLTVSRTVTTPMGEMTMQLVFNKR